MFESVQEGFREYLRRLTPPIAVRTKRWVYLGRIERALAAEFDGFGEVLAVGSNARGTAVWGRSDFDYFATLSAGDVTRRGARLGSGEVMGRASGVLRAVFPRADVRVKGPAVVVNLGRGDVIDVVPGVLLGAPEGAPSHPLYDIADGGGGWRRASPQYHAEYLRQQDERSGRRLTDVVRLLKAWKYARPTGVPVLSFHLEMLFATTGLCLGTRPYQDYLYDAFALLRDRGGDALDDPLGLDDRIAAIDHEAQRAQLIDGARRAAEKARAALAAERAGRLDEAFASWGHIFEGFPSRC